MKISVMFLTLSLLISARDCAQGNNSAYSSAQLSDNSRLSQNIRERQIIYPSDWKQIKSCGVTFYLPSDFRDRKAQGKDSCLGQFQNGYISIKLEVLDNSSDENESRRSEYADNPGCEVKNLLIDGRKAELIDCYDGELPKSVILFVPNMGKGLGSLTIWSYSRGQVGHRFSRQVLTSVKFAD